MTTEPETVHTTDSRYTVEKFVTREDGTFYSVAEDGIAIEDYRRRAEAVARANEVATQAVRIARHNGDVHTS